MSRSRQYTHIDPQEVTIKAEADAKVRTNMGVIWAGAVFLVAATWAAAAWCNNTTNKLEKHSEQLQDLSMTVTNERDWRMKLDAKLTAVELSNEKLLNYFGINNRSGSRGGGSGGGSGP